MKCSKCGAELTEDTKFCSYCGEKVTENPPEISKIEEETPKAESSIGTVREKTTARAGKNGTAGASASKPTFGEKIKSKLLAFWGGLDVFGKIFTVSIAVVVILLPVSIIVGKGFAIFFSILQLAGLIVAALMHKNVIKLDEKKKWIKFLVLAIAIFFIILNVMSYSWGQSNPGRTNSNKDSIETFSAVTVTAPYGAAECLGQDYLTIKSNFSSAGFTSVKVEKIEDLKLSDSDMVNTVESISIDGNTEFDKGQDFNSSNPVVIRYHAYETCKLTIHVDFTENLILSTYDVNLLLNSVEKGTMEHGADKDFELSVDPGEYTLTFESAESSSVKGDVTLTVDCDIDAAYKIYCHSDEVSVETIYVDRLTELAEGEVKLDVPASEYRYKNYAEVETALKVLGFTNIKYEVLYDIVFGITDEGEVENVSIAGNRDFKKSDVFASDAEIIITYHMPEEDNPANITMSEGSSGYEGQNYLDVQQTFKDLGFTNIELGEVTEEDTSYTDGEVFFVEIGGMSFEAGDIFNPDDKVYIKYCHIVESEAGEPVFYSTNDYETAKEGNTGVFSYVDHGGSYDIYWIIDFDEEYVYYFTDGNGEDFCDRLKIESGTLNDKITVTYHDGNDEWSYNFHFKYVDHPETLIMVDNDGFEWKYTTTDLDDALSIRSTKNIKDY